jgi:hypothetical protein
MTRSSASGSGEAGGQPIMASPISPAVPNVVSLTHFGFFTFRRPSPFHHLFCFL